MCGPRRRCHHRLRILTADMPYNRLASAGMCATHIHLSYVDPRHTHDTRAYTIVGF